MRYFIYLQFKGTDYHGWQIQPNGISVQEELEEKVSIYLQEKINVTGAGRTDAGVHAESMIAHFESDKKIIRNDFMFHLNNLLSSSISILTLREVKDDFHARFDALSRTYHYKISTRKSPFQEDFTHLFTRDLNIDLMNQAAEILLGEKDFSCFSKSKTQTFTNICTIEKAKWYKAGDLLVFEVKANRFLRNMVRAIVGTLLEVGEGKRSIDSIPELIESKNRSQAGVSVPAKGLFLVDIEYPNEGFI